MRRGADHGEAYGASIKDGIHRRTLRRKKGKRRKVMSVEASTQLATEHATALSVSTRKRCPVLSDAALAVAKPDLLGMGVQRVGLLRN